MSDLVHRLREPEGPAEGALILNHGRGADENDLFPLLDYLDPDRRLGRESLPVLISHGTADPIISVDFARQARDTLVGGGLAPQYLETEAGHWLPPEAADAVKRLLLGSVRT